MFWLAQCAAVSLWISFLAKWKTFNVVNVAEANIYPEQ